uniref:Ubiquitin carboxyl-terminal hydrolase n=1 Tax=Corvus moneduloides TaxID=1196302 RepID=A0A8C3D0Z3_CORMO
MYLLVLFTLQSGKRKTTVLSHLIKYNFSAVIAEGMALPQRILFPPEEICMDWQQRQRPGAGLCNLGSTCYINVILQCLTYTPPLANYLLSRDHSQLCHRQGFCMMCVMEGHVRKVLRSSASVIWPRAVVRDLKLIGEEFEPDMAGDAYEFLRCALEAMQRACLSGSSDIDISSQTTTIIHQIFGGFLKSRVTCLRCQAVSVSYKAFLHVLLDIKVRGLAIVHFNTLLHCISRCEKKVTVSKRVTVHHVPKVFTVCLERAADHTGKKISKIVEYPEYLDLRPYMSDTAGEPLLYSLYALVVHSGDTCLDGHFFCYTKASNGLWYKMDDESVDNCGSRVQNKFPFPGFAVCLLILLGVSVIGDNFSLFTSVLSILSYAIPVLVLLGFRVLWGTSSEQAGSTATHSQSGSTMSMQRTSAREKSQTRSLQWGNDHCSWFMNSTDSNNSIGRKRKRTSPPGCDHAFKDGTTSGPFNRSCQWAPAPSAASVQHLDLLAPNASSKRATAREQPLLRQREQGRSPQQGYDLRRRFVEITDYHQSAKRRRKHSFGTKRQKSQSQN